MIRRLTKAALTGRAKQRLHSVCETHIHPTARVAYRNLAASPPAVLSIGEGSIFEGTINSDRPGSIVSLGKNTFFGGSTIVCAARITIGNDVLVSWGCTIADHNSHAIDWQSRSNDVKDWYYGRKNWDKVRISPVTIEDKVWIGFNSIILAGVTIGEGAVVACGSIVTKDVAPFTLVGGSPARFIREIPNE